MACTWKCAPARQTQFPLPLMIGVKSLQFSILNPRMSLTACGNQGNARISANLAFPTPTGSWPPAQGCRNPGATDATIHNPNGVVSSLPESARTATPLGLGLLLLNPGLQQPWAGGHDPVGVGNAKLAPMGRCPGLACSGPLALLQNEVPHSAGATVKGT